MNGFERRKEQKKERIRQAALELFKHYGFEKVTIDDIARHASVSRATVYNNFGDKKELVREVIITLNQNLLEKYQTVVKGEGTFIQKIKLIIFDEIETLSQYQGELLTQRVTRIDPELRQFAESIWRREHDRITIELFNEGKREGYVNRELSDEVILAWCEIVRRGTWDSYNLVNISQNVELVYELVTLFLRVFSINEIAQF